jgi:hypothetical protein
MSREDPELEPWESCSFDCADCEHVADCPVAGEEMDRLLQELSAEELASPSEPSGEHAASGDRGRHDGLAREARGLKEQANTLRNLIAEVCSGEEARDLAYRFTRAAESAALRIEGFLEALSPPNRDSRAAIRELARVALHLTHCIELLQQLLECDPELRESTELDQVLGKLAWLRVESLRLQSGLGDDS